MSKNCSVNPLIYKNGELIDSSLFKSLNDLYKAKGLHGLELRNKTKEVYQFLQSDDFKSIFGDWSLYQSAKLNSMTDAQVALFNTVYDGNIDKLESTIDTAHLNELYEPIIDYDIDNQQYITQIDKPLNSSASVINIPTKLEASRLASFSGFDNMTSFFNYITKLGKAIYIESNGIYMYKDNHISNDITTLETGTTRDSELIPTSYSTADLNFISRLASAIVSNNLDDFKNMFRNEKYELRSNSEQIDMFIGTISNKFDDIRNTIIDKLEYSLSTAKSQSSKKEIQDRISNINASYDSIINDLSYRNIDTGRRSLLFASITAYLSRHYGINVNDYSSDVNIEFADENGIIVEREANIGKWDLDSAMSVNRVNNVSLDLKHEISSSVLKDYFSNMANNNVTNTKYGILEPMSIYDVWNLFVSIANTSNGIKSNIIVAIKNANISKYNGQLTSFVNRLESEESLWNSFYSSIVLPIQSNVTVNIQDNDRTLIVRDRVNNYMSFPENIAKQSILNNFQIKIENNKNYLSEISSNSKLTFLQIRQQVFNTDFETVGHKQGLYSEVQRYIDLLGIDLTMSQIHRYIQSKSGIYLGQIGNPFLIGNRSGKNIFQKMNTDLINRKPTSNANGIDYSDVTLPYITDSEKQYLEQVYTNTFRNILVDLMNLSNEALKISKDYHKLKSIKDKRRFKFQDKFNQNGTINKIAQVVAISKSDDVNFSYINEDGNIEYSSQLPSFVTDLFRVFNAAKDQVNDQFVIDSMSKYTSDSFLANNDFLWNYNGAGLFNIETINGEPLFNNGIPVISTSVPINIAFAKIYASGQFSGMKYTNNNTGIKYDSINNDSWKIIAIQAALRGQFILPSSDSPRAYFVQTAKYGLGGTYVKYGDNSINNKFNIDDNGYVISRRDILKQLGLIDQSGNIIDVNSIELNEDSKIYVNFGESGNPIIENISAIGNKEDVSFERDKMFRSLIKLYANNIITVAEELIEDAIVNGDESKISNLRQYIENKDYYKSIGSSKLNDVIENINTVTEKDITEALYDFVKKSFPNTTNEKLNLNRILDTNIEIDESSSLISFDEVMLKSESIFGIKDGKSINILSHIRNQIVKQAKLNKLLNKFDTTSKLRDHYNLIIQDYKHFINNNKVHRAIKNTVKGEIIAMQDVFPKMFNVKYEMINGKRQVISFEPTELAINDANALRLSSPHLSKFVNGKQMIIDNGIPTGRMFKLNRLSYRDSNHNNVTLSSFAKSYFGSTYTENTFTDLLMRTNYASHPLSKHIVSNEEYNDTSDKSNIITNDLLSKDIRLANTIFNNILNDYIEQWYSNTQAEFIRDTDSVRNDLKYMVVDNVPAVIKGTSESEDINHTKHRAYLISTHEEINKRNAHSDTEEELNTEESSTVRDLAKEAKRDIRYNISMLEAAVNDYINRTNIGEDILGGRQYEYKSTEDKNKRDGQTLKNGKSNQSTQTFKSLTIQDQWTVTNMFGFADTNYNDINAELFKERFNDEIENGNGLSMITVNEFINRLNQFNMYEGKFKEYVDALNNPNIEFDFNKYNYIAEQLKYFLYARRPMSQGILKGHVLSFQEKNSTIILFPKMFNNTKYEAITNWMNENGIGELNNLSASKVGGQPIFMLHEEIFDKDKNSPTYGKRIGYNIPTIKVNGKWIYDDRLDRTKAISSDNRRNSNDYVIEHNYSDLRIQQDTVGHIKDEEGILNIQALKKIFVNTDPNHIYKLNGKEYTTKELFTNYQNALSINSESDKIELISKWGGIKDGRINYRPDGTIEIDPNKISKSILDYYTNNADMSLIQAFFTEDSFDEQGMLRLNYNHPTIITQIEQLLQSAITKNVTKQKLNQIHAPILPDTFIQPISYNYGDNSLIKENIITEYAKNGNITFTDEYLAEQVKNGTFELKGEYWDKNGFHPAQMVTNVWDSRFNKYRKSKTITINGKPSIQYYIDINEIPQESRIVYATRIPHEGHQSAVVAEIVGFLNTDSSQIIVPKHLSKRTGWDYDIDTLYVYTKHLYLRSDDKGVLRLYPVSKEYDEKNTSNKFDTKSKQLDSFIASRYSSELDAIRNRKNVAISNIRYNMKSEIADIVLDAKDANDEIINSFIQKPVYRQENVVLLKSIADKLRTYQGFNSNSDIDLIQTYSKIDYDQFSDEYRNYINLINKTIDQILQNDNITDSELDVITSAIIDVNNINKNNSIYYVAGDWNIKAKIKTIRDKYKTEIKDVLKTYKTNIESLRNDPQVNEVFDSLSSIQKMSREVRDNTILDTFISIQSDPVTSKFKDKPNEYSHSKTASNYINTKSGNTDASMNPANLLDMIRITNANKATRSLKGIVISNDNTFAVHGYLSTTLAQYNALPIIMEFNEFGNLSKEDAIIKAENTFGSSNVKVIDDKLYIYNTNLGNNATNTWTNVQGIPISYQSSEVTANVLDAMKDKMGFNIDENTVSILSLFAYSPISFNTNIFGKQDITSFAYSNLLIHQSAIVEYNRMLSNNKRVGGYGNSRYVLRNIKTDIESKIFSLLNNHSIFNNATINGKSTSFANILVNDLMTKNTLGLDDETRVNVISTLNRWATTISNDSQIVMYNSNETNPDIVYNTFITFLQHENVIDIVSDYMSSDTDYDISKIKDIISNIKLSHITSLPLISYKNNTYSLTTNSAVKSLSELKLLFDKGYDKNYANHDLAFKTTMSNDVSIKDIIDFVNYLNDQHDILVYFEHINGIVDTINKSSRILTTDKLGVSPNSSVTIDLFNDILNMYFDWNHFERQLLASGYTQNAIIENRNRFYKESTISGRRSVLEDIVSKHNQAINTGYINTNGDMIEFTNKLSYRTVGLYVGSKQLVDSVYPNFVRNTMGAEYEYGLSSYPYLEAQLNNSNHFSTIAFTQTLLSEKPAIKQLINHVTTKLNLVNASKSTKQRIVNKIIQEVINEEIYNNVAFFNGNYGDVVSKRIFRQKVLGYVPNERNIINDVSSIKQYMQGGIVELINDNNELITYTEFKELSAANKVYLIKEAIRSLESRKDKSIRSILSLTELNDITDFLDLITPQLKKDDLTSNGYHRLSVANTQKDLSKLQQVFKSMFFSTNPFIRIMAQDLVRYTFYTSGLRFGNNLSKFIDMSMYYKNDSSYTEDVSVKDRLYQVNHALYSLDEKASVSFDESFMDSVFTNIIKKNYADQSINNLVKAKTSDYRNKNNLPTWNKEVRIDTDIAKNILAKTGINIELGTESEISLPIIVEDITKINNSTYSKNETLKMSIRIDNKREDHLMRRFTIDGSSNVYYYPISRLLEGEFDDGSVSAVNKYFDTVFTEQQYQDIIQIVDSNKTLIFGTRRDVSLFPIASIQNRNADALIASSDEYQYPVVITQSDKNYFDTAKNIVDNVDKVIYIGSNDVRKMAFASDKSIFVSYNDIDSKFIESIKLNADSKIAIVGDTLSQLKLSQEEVDSKIIPYIKYLHFLNRPISYKSIYKNGIGDSVLKSVFNTTSTSEFIKLGEQDNIRYSTAIPSVSKINLSFNTESDIARMINKQEDSLTTIARINKMLQSFQNNQSANFSWKESDLKTALEDNSDINKRYDALERALDINIEYIDKVINLFRSPIVKLPDGKSITIFNLDINSYMKGNDSVSKQVISSALHKYSIFLQVAKSLMDINLISTIGLTDGLAGDELIAMQETVSKIQNINAKVKYMKTSLPKGLNITRSDIGSYKGVQVDDTIGREDVINNLHNRLFNKIQEFFSSQIYHNTRNPKVELSNYTKKLNDLQANNYELSNEAKEDITTEQISNDLAKIWHDAMEYNEDLNMGQRMLDSVRETGSLLPDNAVKLYLEYRIEAMEIEHERLSQLQSSLDSFTELNSLHGLSKKLGYNKPRDRYFKDRFIDKSTGKLISEYNWNAYTTAVKQYNITKRKYYDLNKLVDAKSLVDSKTESFTIVNNNEGTYYYKDDKTSGSINSKVNLRSFNNTIRGLNTYLTSYNADPISSPRIGEIINEIITQHGEVINSSNNEITYRINLGSFTNEDKTISVYTTIINKNGKYIIKGTGHERIQFNIDNEILSRKDILDKTRSHIVSDRVNTTDSTLAYYEDIDPTSKEFADYLRAYINQGLATSWEAKASFENRYHIKFIDTYASNVTKKNIEKGIYSNTINDSLKANDPIMEDGTQMFNIKRVIPVDKFKNLDYERLTDQEKQYLSETKSFVNDVIRDVFPNTMLAEDFMPYIFIQNKSLLAQFFNWQTIQDENINLDVYGKTQSYLKSRSMTEPTINDLFRIRRKKDSESYTEYDQSILDAANKHLAYLQSKNRVDNTIKPFTNVSEIYAFNDYVKEKYVSANLNKIDYDIPSALKAFVTEMYNIKANNDYLPAYRMMSNIINSPLFKARSTKQNGAKLKDFVAEKVTGKRKYVNKTGSETRIAQRINDEQDNLTRKPRTSSKFDQILGVVNRYSSMNVMWFNYHTGIKNVMAGTSNMMMEALSGEVVDRKQLGKGMNEYNTNIVNILSTFLGGQPAQNKAVAMIQRFHHLYEDHSENVEQNKASGANAKIVNIAEQIGYSFNTAGEHFMQMSMMLALSHSHRVVDDEVMNISEFSNNGKFKVIKDLLTTEQQEDLLKYIEYRKSNTDESKYYHIDYVTDWLTRHGREISNKSEINKAITEFNKDVKAKFAKFKEVYDYFNFKDGKVEYNEGFNKRLEEQFTNRVTSVNQTMHGVYNTIDRGAIQNHLYAEVLLQFRKWIRPNYIRYFGAKYRPFSSKVNNPFSERLGYARSGAFADFSNFMRSPYISAMYQSKDDNGKNNPLRAFSLIWSQYIEFFTNMKFYYNALNTHQQANVKRSMAFAGFLSLATVLLIAAPKVLRSIIGDDDNDDPTRLENWLVYNLSGLQTEYIDVLPIYGQYMFYQRTKQNIAPAERQIDNTIDFINELCFAYPFQTDKERKYSRGIYKGEYKLAVKAEKMIPIWRQFQKEFHLQSSINYYNMVNPISALSNKQNH